MTDSRNITPISSPRTAVGKSYKREKNMRSTSFACDDDKVTHRHA